MPPFPARYCHSTAPCLSGSNAQPTPDFWPATMMSRPPAIVVRIGALPKSWSGPISAAGAQLAPVGPVQPITKISFGVTCDVHLIAPVSRSNAMIASLVGCCGSVYMLPVAAYTTWRLTSTVGADQTPPPDGPQRVVP